MPELKPARCAYRRVIDAFVMHNKACLLASWHHSTRSGSVTFDSATKWLGLKVIEVNAIKSDSAAVEFIAPYWNGGDSAA